MSKARRCCEKTQDTTDPRLRSEVFARVARRQMHLQTERIKNKIAFSEKHKQIREGVRKERAKAERFKGKKIRKEKTIVKNET